MANPQDAIADGGQTRVGVRARERQPARAGLGQIAAAAARAILNHARKGGVSAVVYGEGRTLLDLHFAVGVAAVQSADGLVAGGDKGGRGSTGIREGHGARANGPAECAGLNGGRARAGVGTGERERVRGGLGQRGVAGQIRADGPALGRDAARVDGQDARAARNLTAISQLQTAGQGLIEVAQGKGTAAADDQTAAAGESIGNAEGEGPGADGGIARVVAAAAGERERARAALAQAARAGLDVALDAGVARAGDGEV